VQQRTKPQAGDIDDPWRLVLVSVATGTLLQIPQPVNMSNLYNKQHLCRVKQGFPDNAIIH